MYPLKIVTLLIVMLNGSFALASASELSNSPSKIVYVCDSVISGHNQPCSVYDPLKLESLARSLLSPGVTWECEQNPTDPTCEDSQGSLVSSEVHFLVINADSADATYYLAKNNMFGLFTFNAIVLDTEAQNIATQVYSLNTKLIDAAEKYSFEQVDDGSFLNQHNESIESLSPSIALAASSTDTPQPCQSAIAYLDVQGCSEHINGMIIKENDGSIMAGVFEGARDIHFSIGLAGFQVSTEITGIFEVTLNFKDGSKLVIEVKPGENVSIRVMEHKSFTSGKGKTFAEYLRNLDDNGINTNLSYSGGEARSLFMGFPECYNVAQIIGYTREYLVSVAEYPDGTKAVIAIRLIGSNPIWDQTVKCELRRP